MRVIIVGAGRVGARLANSLNGGHEVTLVDIDPSSFRRVGPAYRGRMIEGNGIDIDVLRDAGVERADALIAVTNGDNRNLMAAQIARTMFEVPRVVARVYDPVRAAIFEERGLKTISPTVMGAQRLFDSITSASTSV